jgi:GYF domain 2
VSDPIRYYLSEEGKRLGPYSAQQIRKRLNQGKSVQTDYIWRDGFEDWKCIADVMSELPSEEPPPAPEPVIPSSLSINHPGFPDIPTTKLDIPPRGVFEPKATLSQKNKLMKLGCTTPELLRNLGRDQASFMIDAFLEDAQAVFDHESHRLALAQRLAQRRAVGIALSVLLAIAAICVVVWMVVALIGISSSTRKPVTLEPQVSKRSLNGLSKSSTPTISPNAIVDRVGVAPSTSPLTVSSPLGFTPVRDPKVVTITKPISIAVLYGSVNIPAGTKLPFLSRAGDKVRVRYYDGAGYDIPISATDLK